MTHIICRASICLFWEQGVCGAEEIAYEPDVGCLAFQDMGDLELQEAEDEEFGWEESSSDLFDDDDDDAFDDDDEWDDEEEEEDDEDWEE